MSFMEGFGSSLGGFMQQYGMGMIEEQSYKRKLELAKKLEAETPVKYEQFAKGNQIFTQALNSAGKPVGEPEPANEFQIASYTREQEDRTRAKTKDDLNIEESRLGIANISQLLANRPIEMSRDSEKHTANMKAEKAQLGLIGAQTNSTNASAAQSSAYAARLKDGTIGGQQPRYTDPTPDPAWYQQIMDTAGQLEKSGDPVSAAAAKQIKSVANDQSLSAKEKEIRVINVMQELGAAQEELQTAPPAQQATAEDMARGMTSDRSPVPAGPSILEQLKGSASAYGNKLFPNFGATRREYERQQQSQ